eukprot:TRINITY_DN1491_c0_g1_i3.p1 TRINITY_DN1491_c0_g1~~TRINITY_DN1491_c0_g1_i3.p1  ORF type:complete len:138 (-),score=0.18 TRINITY_DN1491_c0_g1_i3:24-437(-)
MLMLVLYVLLLIECCIIFLECLPLPSNVVRGYINAGITAVWDRSKYSRVLISAWWIINLLVFLESMHPQYHRDDTSAITVEQKMISQNRLLRNQRNAYISGFACFLMLVLYRIHKLQQEIFQLRSFQKKLEEPKKLK